MCATRAARSVYTRRVDIGLNARYPVRRELIIEANLPASEEANSRPANRNPTTRWKAA